MADFSKVDVVLLKNALGNALDNLSCDNTSTAIDDLVGNEYWSSNSKNTFLTALKSQTDTNYANLKSKLEDYILIADYIAEWKRIDEDIQSYITARDDAKGKINVQKTRYKLDSEGNYIYDMWGNKKTEKYTEYSQYWDNQYNSYVNKIAENEELKKEYEDKINELI